jgi:lysozyme
MQRKASPQCIALIKSFESLALKAYRCPADVWTIGWGHTAGVKEGDVITEAQAEAYLEADIAAVEAVLPQVIHAELTQGEWDALVSLAFNLRGGAHGLPRIAPHLVAYVEDGRRSLAADEFLDINKGGGRVLPGLTRRRQAERAMFLS